MKSIFSSLIFFLESTNNEIGRGDKLQTVVKPIKIDSYKWPQEI